MQRKGLQQDLAAAGIFASTLRTKQQISNACYTAADFSGAVSQVIGTLQDPALYLEARNALLEDFWASYRCSSSQLWPLISRCECHERGFDLSKNSRHQYQHLKSRMSQLVSKERHLLFADLGRFGYKLEISCERPELPFEYLLIRYDLLDNDMSRTKICY